MNNTEYLTLDASDSCNPNELDTKKQLIYTWRCDNQHDASICDNFTTTGIRLIYCFIIIIVRNIIKIQTMFTVYYNTNGLNKNIDIYK